MSPEKNHYQIDKRQVRRAFEKAAVSYDSAAVLQKEVGNRLLERLDYVKLKPRIILDVGAGTGHATKRLGSRYRKAKVIALDIAISMLRQTHANSSFIKRPALTCGDAESLPFADGIADLLYSNLTLQWCNNLSETFREFLRTMAPGGLLTFTTFGPETLNELRQSWITDTDAYTHVNTFMDMHDIGDALIQAGFSDPVMDTEKMTLTYQELSKLLRELKLIGASNKTSFRLRGLMGKTRFSQMQQAYEVFRTHEGLLPSTYEIIYGHAWKPADRENINEFKFPISRLRHSRGTRIE